VSYLLNHLTNDLSLETYNRLYSEELGIKMVVQLSSQDQQRLKHLVGQPNLIIEWLMMESRIPLVESLMRQFPELQNNQLVMRYAAKAIAFNDTAKQWKKQKNAAIAKRHQSIASLDVNSFANDEGVFFIYLFVY